MRAAGRSSGRGVGRWLRVERGPWCLVANVGSEATAVPCPAGAIEVRTDPAVSRGATAAGEPAVVLPPLAGAIVHAEVGP